MYTSFLTRVHLVVEMDLSAGRRIERLPHSIIGLPFVYIKENSKLLEAFCLPLYFATALFSSGIASKYIHA